MIGEANRKGATMDPTLDKPDTLTTSERWAGGPMRPDRANYETVTFYRYAGPEVHGHASYFMARKFAEQRVEANPVGTCSVQINRLEANDKYPDGVRNAWIETVGGVRW